MMGPDGGRGFVRNQLPAILWALLIFASSSVPGRTFPSIGFPHLDKIVHFCYYFIFAILVARALRSQSRFPDLSRFSLVLGFLLSIAYGVSDEAHQLFVPERSFDPQDLFSDMAGALLAVAILGMVRRASMARDKTNTENVYRKECQEKKGLP